MREVHSPPPQPEDHNRALDPGLKEDSDVFVELVDRMFYLASCDGTLVAIIADYPGLLPASYVSKIGFLTSESIPSLRLTHRTRIALYREGHRGAAPNPPRLTNRGTQAA